MVIATGYLISRPNWKVPIEGTDFTHALNGVWGCLTTQTVSSKRNISSFFLKNQSGQQRFTWKPQGHNSRIDLNRLL